MIATDQTIVSLFFSVLPVDILNNGWPLITSQSLRVSGEPEIRFLDLRLCAPSVLKYFSVGFLNIQPSIYSNHPNTGHPNTGFIWIPDFLVSGFGMAWIHRYKKYVVVLVSMDPNHSKTGLKCPVFEWPPENWTIRQLEMLWPFANRNSPVFGWLLYNFYVPS